MSRFETKCFVGSAGLHGLLLAVVLVGSAFQTSKSQKLPPVFSIMSIPTDRLVSSGGNPNGNPNPAAPQPEQITPPPPQLPPKPEVVKKIEPEPEKEPPKPKEVVKPEIKEPKKEIVKDTPKDKGELPTKKETKPEKKPTPSKEVANTTPKKTISTNVITRSTADLAASKRKADQERAERAEREAAAAVAAQRQALAKAVNGIIGGVGQSLGKNTVVEPLGPGGVAYANWGSLVGELYKREVYRWQPQSDADATAVIRVVVERNGFVKEAAWVRKTGNSSLDRAVDRAMKEVRHVPQFPEGATDSERSFNINIGFEARRVSA